MPWRIYQKTQRRLENSSKQLAVNVNNNSTYTQKDQNEYGQYGYRRECKDEMIMLTKGRKGKKKIKYAHFLVFITCRSKNII